MWAALPKIRGSLLVVPMMRNQHHPYSPCDLPSKTPNHKSDAPMRDPVGT